MSAPDKIYVREFAEGLSQMWSGTRATETSATAQHEYIRKDALIKWAKVQAKHFSARSDELEVIDPTNPDVVFFDGKRDAFTEMIKRIESL